MKFNLQQAIQILERTPQVVTSMLRGLDNAWTKSNEGKDTWSPYDIIGHYIHGEKTDWIPRMEIILGHGDKHFIPFDRFAQFRDSKGKSLDDLLDEFSSLRSTNISKLTAAALSDSDLQKTGIHPEFGPVTLEQLLAAWVAHDLTHIYQISRVMARQYDAAVGPWKEFMRILNDR